MAAAADKFQEQMDSMARRMVSLDRVLCSFSRFRGRVEHCRVQDITDIALSCPDHGAQITNTCDWWRVYNSSWQEKKHYS